MRLDVLRTSKIYTYDIQDLFAWVQPPHDDRLEEKVRGSCELRSPNEADEDVDVIVSD